MDPILRCYYRQRQYRGRSAAARIVDGVAIRLLFAALSFLWFRSQVPNTAVVWVLTGVTALLFCIAAGLWSRLRFDGFVEREQERLREEVALERLLLEPREKFARMVGDLAWALPEAKDAYLAILQQAEPLTRDGVLRAYHAARARGARRMLLCCAGPCTEEATGLSKRLPIPAELFDRKRLARALLESGVLTIPDETIGERIKSMAEAEKDRRKAVQGEAFRAGSAGRYLLLSGILFGLSFFGSYALYYRLLSALCGLFAAVSFWINRAPQSREMEL